MSAALRSLLFVPGDRPDLVAKVGQGGRERPDVVALDLEDAVGPDGKDGARRAALDVLTSGRPKAGIVLVRINPFGTPWHDADVDAVVSADPNVVDGVVLPKFERVSQLEELRDRLPSGQRVVVGLETAIGMAECRALLAARPDAAYIGAEDLMADLGGRRTGSNHEVAWARAEFRLAGRLADVAVIDQAVVAVHDEDRFAREVEEARDFGFHGKICLNPRQVAQANVAFTPSGDEIAHARAVLDALRSTDERGVALVNGVMVDAVHVTLARSVLARAGEVPCN